MNNAPSAIVLCSVGTGLATVRCLGHTGLEVHAFIFERAESVNYSRYCRKVRLYDISDADLIVYLIDYAKRLGNRPVVLPSCDKHALLIAKHAAELNSVCRVWTTEYSDLASLINKDSLYTTASALELPVVPCVCQPTLREASEWSSANKGPYFLKPSYEGVASSRLREKNLLIQDRNALLKYIEKYEATSLVVQRMLSGGDGYIFDCYGLCDKNGSVVTIASHRRWRQNLPDFGATCFGEIPAAELDKKTESLLFERTKALLKKVRYHGIFGVEWLLERETGNFYIIDFNARPFLTIGHLEACGLNLPALAYLELIDQNLGSQQILQPKLRHLYWVDLLKDIETFVEKYRKGQIKFGEWILSLLRCRSFAYWDWRDPAPGLHRMIQIIVRTIRFPLNRFLNRKTAATY